MTDPRDRPLRYVDCPRLDRLPYEPRTTDELVTAAAWSILANAVPLPPTLAEFTVEVERRNRESPRSVSPAEVAGDLIGRWKADGAREATRAERVLWTARGLWFRVLRFVRPLG